MTVETASQHDAPASLAPIYVASMVCSMGMMGFVATAGPLAVSLGLEAWHMGLSATAGGVGWVLSARFWGKTADRAGRKPVLLFGLTGFTVVYFVLCLAVLAGERLGVAALYVLAVMILARFGMGLSYSAVPAAGSAIIADTHSADERAGAMGRLGEAQAAGLLFGPATVAILAGDSPATVLLFLAAMPLPALAFVAARLPKDAPKASAVAKQLSLADPRLIRPLIVSLLLMLAVTIAQIVIGFVAMERLALPERKAMRLAGGALAGVGVSLIVAQLAVKRLAWSPTTLIRVGGSVSAAGFIFASLAASPLALVLAYALAGFGAGWAMPGISAYAANAVSAEEQGRAAGAISSAMGLRAMVGPLLGGLLYQMSGTVPFYVAGAAFAMAALIPRAHARPLGAKPAA